MRLVSPNEMLKAAKDEMLAGKEPESLDDWAMIMNFLAANVDKKSAHAACRLFVRLYDMPLTDEFVDEIVDFQLARR